MGHDSGAAQAQLSIASPAHAAAASLRRPAGPTLKSEALLCVLYASSAVLDVPELIRLLLLLCCFFALTPSSMH
jgi:hypothetical protein